MLSELKLLNLEDRVHQVRLNHVFRIFNDQARDYMHQNFIRVTDQHHHCTRNSSVNYVVPQVNGILSRTFYYNAIKNWNSLPADIRKIKNKTNFKDKVKLFLNNQAIANENKGMF